MSTPSRIASLCAASVVAFSGFAVLGADARRGDEGPGLGRTPSAQDIAHMDISVDADGAGLPPGSGSAVQGATVYLEKCQVCHGPAGAGGMAVRLTGGVGSIASAAPSRTVSSYWPYAPPVFDYIRRAMPLNAPQSLADDEVYALVAYLLSIDGVVPADAVLDAQALPKIAMPNRNGFISLEARGFDGNVDHGRKRPARVSSAGGASD